VRTVTAYTCSSAYEIPEECVRDICRPGRNDGAVASWAIRIDWDSLADPATIRAELREAGWSDDELRHDDENRCRFVWVLAWNVHDEQRGDDAIIVRFLPRDGLT
jgi:hypothetical protein